MCSYRRRGRGSECVATGGEGEVVSVCSYRRRGRGSECVATGGEGEVVSA